MRSVLFVLHFSKKLLSTSKNSGDGYATAWLMWQLQGDENAAKAFIGPQLELFGNPLYQEQRADLLEE